ncbi:hypothetical protein QJQ45_028049, partial [Haematococcus lacustris]
GHPVAFSGAMEGYLASVVGQRVEAPAATRNTAPILELLTTYLKAAAPGLVLEVASGTGQHLAAFAQALPHLTWQASDLTPELFRSIEAHCTVMGEQGGAPLPLANVQLPPLLLDACLEPGQWPAAVSKAAPLAAMLAVNITHIAPWAATQGLMRGAGAFLRPGGFLFVYGPFKVNGRHTSEGNVAFDASLRARDPAWGYRDVADMQAEAAGAGLASTACHAMPANNQMLVFTKQ